MSKTFIIPLAILGMFATSGAAFAAQQPSGDSSDQHVRHMKHFAAPRQTQAPQYARQPWILPEGWPHT